MKYPLLFSLLAGLQFQMQAQQPATTPESNLEALKEKAALTSNSRVQALPLENIGPSIMSGRVTDIAVNPKDPTEFYVGYASGGLWHTNNNGTTFTPVMDNAPTQNIGDLAVNWETGTIWVGTGENNASRSSYAGIGMLRSDDQGATWTHSGLPDAHHIGRIILHPEDPNTLWVGVTGHLYSPNEERGVYKSTDGGKTWKKTLYINNETGIIDLAAVPGDPQTLFATAWQKDRKAWNFIGNGNGSGIYKSTDGGENWTLITTEESGFPTGEGVGRIGLAIYNNNTIFAIHDNQFHREKKGDATKDKDHLSKDDFKEMDVETFLALDNKKLNTYLKTNGFQEKYRAENVKQLVRSGAVKPIDLANYLEDANAMLFDTPVIGAEVYKSTDGGATWSKTHEGSIEDLFYSYGYYFCQIAVDPNNPEKLYAGGVPIIRSDDGGKTWKSINGDNVHADHHSIWINPEKPGHIINGNDGGVNISYDDGESWIKNNTPSVGQFYAIEVDNQEPYHIYGGLQDNGVWMAPRNARENTSWHQQGEYPWKMIMGGDGMQVEVDPRNPNIVYTGFQFGNYFRIDLEAASRKYIQPKHELGDRPYRFNWQTPILLSPHNADILYLGGNKLMRSMDKGDTWEAISDDLTTGGKPGNVAYGTLTTVSESPFRFGLLYTGSDDGLIHVSENGGSTWKLISESLPKDLWVSRVIASAHDENTVYATLNGYRWDDFTPYVYVSTDKGTTWKNISSNLPLSPVNVIIEDPSNKDLLFAGTDNGLYASFDGGMHWEPFSNNLPEVAVHDLAIQERESDLVVGTHGRGIYVIDIAALQHANANVLKEELVIFELPETRRSPRWGASRAWGNPYEPEMEIVIYSLAEGEATLEVTDDSGNKLKTFSSPLKKGFNLVAYDLSADEDLANRYNKKNRSNKLRSAANGTTYLPKGTFTLKVKKDKATTEKSFEIK
ncbi:VPS10 domain-containing protein [Robertkochia sediminum]|uniref:VPS10 domain-containing protein n=1 Tax=Robertkochia sediminum TaxID=2785326 RepID=UPI001932A29E|nr:sialidase family protein [Robertkochia sediminum]MBL7471813.1 glycosyl hydrolase [Robertkochia sediminum]